MSGEETVEKGTSYNKSGKKLADKGVGRGGPKRKFGGQLTLSFGVVIDTVMDALLWTFLVWRPVMDIPGHGHPIHGPLVWTPVVDTLSWALWYGPLVWTPCHGCLS